MSLLRAIESITLGNLGGNVNIYSYMTLKGVQVLRAKLKNEEYVKLRMSLLREISKSSSNVFQLLSDQIGRLIEEVGVALKANGYRVKECVIRSTHRFVGGFGENVGQVPFEVGLFFDTILGIPYIPGSTLKGAFRHSFIDLTGDEKLAETLFGSQEGMGLVGVTDAYPIGLTGRRLLEPDVITPHYPGASTEFEAEPKPVTFLTVAPGVEFKFYIYYKDKDEVVKQIFHGDLSEAIKEMKKEDPLKLLGNIDKAIFYALARGVGAKTSTGYSRFELIVYKDY